jgi:LPS-assembly protein
VAPLRSPLCPTSLRSVRVSATALTALVLCLMSLVFGPAASAQDALTQGLFGQASPGQRTPAQGGAPQDQSGQDVSQGPISPLHFAPRPPQPPKKPAPPSNQPMLVQATEIRYDYTNNSVAAVGNVQIYYSGATVEADQVTYDQKTKRLVAEGNVRLTEPDGKITYGQKIDLTDDYRDGFVDSLRLETPDDTRFAASRADRSKGNYTVLQNGVYTACEPCKDDPKKPPLWQVQAARIIHDEGEKMVYFEDARVEFFGVPIAYFPFLSAPDPTVKRKSGFLFPDMSWSTSQYGFGFGPKYFWALAPNADLTLGTLLTTKQGPLFDGEWRQRLLSGSYSIRAAGIFQTDPGYFASRDGPDSPTAQTFRGAIQTAGQFAITDKWTWGWTGLLMTDSQFIQDYQTSQIAGSYDPFQTGLASAGVSQLYLTGAGDRSYLDIRSMYFLGFSEFDNQGQIPIIHPVLDYSNVLAHQVLGGELSYKFNLTSLTRTDAEFDATTFAAANGGGCSSPTADTAIPSNCLLRAIPGSYTRASAEVDWRRTLVTDNGQMITPFFQLRGDIASLQVNNQPGVSNYIATGDTQLARAMPAVGVEYRYPFVDVQPWGTQTIEPIAQIIIRPNETDIGKFPNEDSQSLVFSDTNLFSIDKYSGYDRVEGGSRANVGVQYTAQVNRAGSFNVLFGESYSLFGQNSFEVGDITNTGLESGLDKRASDYVGRVSYSPDSVYTFTARGRFDQQTFTPERLEVESRANFDRWTVQLLYGDYAAQPDLSLLTRREGILGGASFKVTSNWVLLGSLRYDLINDQFDQTRIGVGYVDDCFMLSVNWLEGYTYTPTQAAVRDSTIMFQFSLRTLGPDVLAPIASSF